MCYQQLARAMHRDCSSHVVFDVAFSLQIVGMRVFWHIGAGVISDTFIAVVQRGCCGGLWAGQERGKGVGVVGMSDSVGSRSGFHPDVTI